MAGQVGRGQRRSGARLAPHAGAASRGRQRLRRAAGVALAHGVLGAAASPVGGWCRTLARCPGGSGVSGGRLASLRRAVSRWQRRLRRAAGVALAHGVRGAARVALAPRPRGSSRTSRTPWRHARGVALAHRARSRDLRCGGHGSGGSWWSQSQGAAHGCLSGNLVLCCVGLRGFHVEQQAPQPGAVVLAPGGHCCACPSQRGLRPRAKFGRSRCTGKRAVPGAALAGRRRGAGGARAGRGRGAGEFGALVAVVAHYKKCSEWRRTRSPSLALFGRPPLHFL